MENTLYRDICEYKNKTTAIYFKNKKISFNSLNERIDTMASRLYKLGIQKDNVVTLLSPNIPEAVIAFYALNKIGAIVSILHPLIPIKALSETISTTKSEFLLLFSLRYTEYEEELKNSNIKTLFISIEPDLNFIERCIFKRKYSKELSLIDESKVITSIREKEEILMEFPINDDSEKISTYLRSGGTTGNSKIVILSDKAIRYAGTQSDIILNRSIQNMSMIGVLPMFHGFGLAMGIHAPLMHNASVFLMLNFSIDELSRGINKNQVNILVGVPYMVEKMLQSKKFCNSKLKNLYMTFIGADKMNEMIEDEFNNLMKKKKSQNKIYEGYGLTEMVTVSVVNTMTINKKGSVGKPLNGIKVKIVNPEKKSIELPDYQCGEILLSGPSECLGYMKTPKKNQPFFVDYDKTVYVTTGDIGYVDDEGFLFFKNREKDVIKIAGFNVFPKDIEALASEIDGVIDACAIFIEEEHPYIHLFIENHTENDNVLKEKIQKHLKENLIKYSLPEKISILPQFPRTSIGKIDKKALIHF